MQNFATRKRLSAGLMCIAVAAGSAFIGTALADDMKPMPPSETMKAPMMAMKDGMKDDAAKMQMTQDLAKMMVMQKMAMGMVHDEKSMKMLADDPEMMKMMDDAKTMAMDPDKSKMMMDDVSKDPEAMKKVMMMTMAHDAMMKDKGMEMGKGMMDKGKDMMDKK